MMPRPMSLPPPTSPAGPSPDGDEAALVERLRAGDRRPSPTLVDRHGGALLRLATTFVKDGALAEEVVQDAWLAALDGLDGFEGRSSLRTWLFSILANKARNRAVREGRSVPWSALGGDGEDGPAVGSRTASRPTATGRSRPGAGPRRTRSAWRSGPRPAPPSSGPSPPCPRPQRAVVTLRDVEGLEAEEICNLLGLTLTNQRVLLHRARTRVRRALEEFMAGAR